MATEALRLPMLDTLKPLTRWPAPVGRDRFVNLDLNESGYGADEPLVGLYRLFTSGIISMYPEYDSFLAQLGDYAQVAPKQLVLTNGADQGIELLCRLFFSASSRVLVPSPVFSYYYHVLTTLGAEIVPAYYTKKKETFEFPIDDVLAQVKHVQGVVLCNPNNPLGSVMPMEMMRKILEQCQRQNIPCLIDEAYFGYHGETALEFLKDFPNLVVVRTFSKFFCLSGLRLGYVIAHPHVVKELLKLRGPWDVNHFSVFAGTICLRNLAWFEANKERVMETKSRLGAMLRQRGIGYFDSQTNFVVAHNAHNGWLGSTLAAHGIRVADLGNYPLSDGLLKGYLRLTIPTEEGFAPLARALVGDLSQSVGP